jgi:hypothetical protein
MFERRRAGYYHGLLSWIDQNMGKKDVDYQLIFIDYQCAGIKIFDDHKRTLFMLRWG